MRCNIEKSRQYALLNLVQPFTAADENISNFNQETKNRRKAFRIV